MNTKPIYSLFGYITATLYMIITIIGGLVIGIVTAILPIAFWLLVMLICFGAICGIVLAFLALVHLFL